MKTAFYRENFVVEEVGKGTLVIVSTPEDWTNPRLPPGDAFRAYVVLNTIIYNYTMLNLYRRDFTQFEWYKKYGITADIRRLRLEYEVKSNDISSDLMKRPRRIPENKKVMEFKGNQVNLFHHVVAVFYINLEERRYADFDEILKVTKSFYRSGYSYLIRHATDDEELEKLEESRYYVPRKMREITKKELDKLCRLGFLDVKYGRFYCVTSSERFVDKNENQIFLPPLELVEAQRLRIVPLVPNRASSILE